MTIQVIWTYRVRKDSVAEFERYYRSDGVWAELFRKSPQYHGTTLLHDRDDPLKYATIDRWDSWDVYQAFLREHKKEYDWIDNMCAEFTTEEARVGCFEVIE